MTKKLQLNEKLTSSSNTASQESLVGRTEKKVPFPLPVGNEGTVLAEMTFVESQPPRDTIIQLPEDVVVEFREHFKGYDLTQLRARAYGRSFEGGGSIKLLFIHFPKVLLHYPTEMSKPLTMSGPDWLNHVLMVGLPALDNELSQVPWDPKKRGRFCGETFVAFYEKQEVCDV